MWARRGATAVQWCAFTMAEQRTDKRGSASEQDGVVESAPGTTECDSPDAETRLAVQKALDEALVAVGLGKLTLSREGEGEGESVHVHSNDSGIAETPYSLPCVMM